LNNIKNNLSPQNKTVYMIEERKFSCEKCSEDVTLNNWKMSCDCTTEKHNGLLPDTWKENKCSKCEITPELVSIKIKGTFISCECDKIQYQGHINTNWSYSP
jgi:hypothetical protein